MKEIDKCHNVFRKRAFYSALISFVFCLFLQVNGFSQAPGISWQKTYGGSSTDEVIDIIETSDGGYAFVGRTHSMDFDVVGSYGSAFGDCWLVKTDPAGNIQWQKVLGGTSWDNALSIKQTADNGFIIAGHSESNDGDIPGNYTSPDAIIFKVDQSGNVQWSRNLGGVAYDVIISIDITADGGYICAGYTASNNIDVFGNHGDLDAWILKLDQSGNIEWQKCVGGSLRDVAWSIEETPDGGFVFTGHSNSTDGDITSPKGGYDVMVGKLDALGNMQWLRNFGGSSEDQSFTITCTPDGGFIVAGYTRSSNGDVTASFGLNDVWILKLNVTGNLQWQRSYGGSNYEDPYDIAVTASGNYVVVGRTLSTDGDISFNHGNNDFWILQIDQGGTLQWQKSLGGTSQDIGQCIKVTTGGEIILGGRTMSNDGDVSYLRGVEDCWVVKLGDCTLATPEMPATIAGSLFPCVGTNNTYSIPPVNNATGFTWIFPTGWTIVSGQGTAQVLVTVGATAGNLNVLAYNECRSSAVNSVALSPVSVPLPQINIAASPGTANCQGTTVSFTAQTSAANAASYQWKKNGNNVGANTASYTDNTLINGDIIGCELTAGNACSGQTVVLSPTITMSVNPTIIPTISITSNSSSICQGQTVRFTSSCTNEGNNPTYAWYINNTIAGTNLATFETNTLLDGDIVTCRILSGENCSSATAVISNSIAIQVQNDPATAVMITSNKTTICQNDEVTLVAIPSNAGTAPSYKWFVNGTRQGAGNASQVIRNLHNNDEIYCVVTPGTNTCSTAPAVSNRITIIINPPPQVYLYPADTIVVPGSIVVLKTLLSEPIQSFSWLPAIGLSDPFSLNPATQPIVNPATFRLNIVTKDGCVINKTAVIKPLFPLHIPNSFTPNNDGINDLFRVPPYTNFQLSALAIFNKWGEAIYTTTKVDEGWNGLYKGIAQPIGTYTYLIKGSYQNKPVVLKGTVTLIR